ncbi:hypothetical protein [Flavobacterium tyrosinilyticum]|uniref:hypothetical protein n=1 Tax=Flavobacterium tyrosinilyticum TaxID=1658740 RepID=UPI00202E7BA1|nr:hypothetical protein [Flavobacterium tyrosinilyticum]MCM0666388.1 hypothetical protein [Flavobacterium tyrosinilyticum]
MNIILLILNILGTFLVSVEAIKLDNLIKFQKYLLNSNKTLNPDIPGEGSGKTSILSKIGCFGFLGRIMLIFYIPSFAFAYLIFNAIVEKYGIIIIAIFGSFVVWTALIILIEITIKILKSIVKHTENGMIGIIGFLILVISFVLQYYSSKQ